MQCVSQWFCQMLAEFDICTLLIKCEWVKFRNRCCVAKFCFTRVFLLHHISRHASLYGRIIQHHKQNLEIRLKMWSMWQMVLTNIFINNAYFYISCCYSQYYEYINVLVKVLLKDYQTWLKPFSVFFNKFFVLVCCHVVNRPCLS